MSKYVSGVVLETKTPWNDLFCRVLWLSQRLFLGCWGFLGGDGDDLMGRKQVTVTIKTWRFFFWFEAKGMEALKSGGVLCLVHFFFVSGGHKDEDNLFCVDKKILSNKFWKVVHFWHSSLRWRLFWTLPGFLREISEPVGSLLGSFCPLRMPA